MATYAKAWHKDQLTIKKLKKQLEKSKDEFSKGYTCACANLVQMHGESTEATKLYAANYLSVSELRKIGVEESDIDKLKPVIKEIQAKRRRIKQSDDLKKKPQPIVIPNYTIPCIYGCTNMNKSGRCVHGCTR